MWEESVGKGIRKKQDKGELGRVHLREHSRPLAHIAFYSDRRTVWQRSVVIRDSLAVLQRPLKRSRGRGRGRETS